MRLKGKVAVITGATGGIGAAISRLFGQNGASLALWDIIEPKELVEELKSFNGRYISYSVDITRSNIVEEAAEKVQKDFGKVDILINNAGITRDNLILRMKDGEWEDVLKVNLTGAFFCTRTISRMMAKSRSGKIINISSIIGIGGNIGQANYSASKAGLLGLTRSSARELSRFGIRVNAIAPGYIETPMTAKLNSQIKEKIKQNIPLSAFGKPEDVARTALFLGSSESDYVTGEVIKVDGGLLME